MHHPLPKQNFASMSVFACVHQNNFRSKIGKTMENDQKYNRNVDYDLKQNSLPEEVFILICRYFDVSMISAVVANRHHL